LEKLRGFEGAGGLAPKAFEGFGEVEGIVESEALGGLLNALSVFEPAAARHAIYQKKHALYRQLFSTNHNLLKQL